MEANARSLRVALNFPLKGARWWCMDSSPWGGAATPVVAFGRGGLLYEQEASAITRVDFTPADQDA